MFGDFSPAVELIELLEEISHFYCYLNNAHGTSIFGEKGIGYVLSQSSS
jgi:7-keto-8-aminopelargonate synthetase-like enzyme